MYFLGREVLLVCVTRTTEYAQLDNPRRIKPMSDGSPFRRVEAAMPLGVQLLHPPHCPARRPDGPSALRCRTVMM